MSIVKMTIKNIDDAREGIKKLERQSETVIKHTVSDFKRRAPGWVSKTVREYYGISAGDLKDQVDLSVSKKAAGKIRVSGKTIESLSLVYTGRRLTPLHFRMTPKVRPGPTKTGKRSKRLIKATIKRGNKKPLGSNVFLAAPKGRSLPFVRKGEDRMPIKSIKTVSIPQMISNDQVSKEIQKNISEGLEERLEHHTKREMAKR